MDVYGKYVVFAILLTCLIVLGLYVVGVAPRHIIQHVSRGMNHSFGQRLNGIADGTYVAVVRRLHSICAILVHTPCAMHASKVLIMCV